MENIFVEFLPPWVETGLQPAFYDKESGTVLQQTARMYARVNMLIRMFNKLSKETKKVVEEYIGKFNELHDYVYYYFDNLDVQEEINNKLDAMAETGDLENIIAAYLDTTAVFGFRTVSDMLSAENIATMSYAKTTGYYSDNDGGGATYFIRDIEENETANGYTTLLVGDSKIAELVHDGTLNMLQIGANADNFSDCANFALTNGYKVYVPRGSYTAKHTINIVGNDLAFEADGDITSQDTILFHVEGYRNYVHLNGRCIGDNTVNSVCMYIGGSDANCVCNNVYIHSASGFGIGVKLCPENGKGVAYTQLNFDYIGGIKLYGILITTGTGVNFVAENNFTGGRIAGAADMLSGIKFIKGTNQTDPFNANIFEHVCIDENYQIGIDIEFALYNKFNNTRLSEGLRGTYYVQLGEGCRYNYISTKSSFRTSQINDLTTSREDKNFFGTRLVDASTYVVADKFYTANGFFIVERADCVYGLNRTNLLYTYNTTDNPTLPEFYVNNGTLVRLGHDASGSDTFTYTLPAVFNQANVNEFYLEITNLSSGNDIEILSSTGTVIVNRSSLGSGTINKKWFKVEYVAQFDGNIWKVTPMN